MKLESAERRLIAAIAEGYSVDLGVGELRCDVLRRIILGLPLRDDTTLWSEVKRLLGRIGSPRDFDRTPVGISLRGGVVKGRLDLSSATGEEGGPMPPLVFERTRLIGGFAGAHAHFARLSFNRCCFADGENLENVPTIDLSGSAIDSDLHMSWMEPAPVILGEPGNHLWIRLNGARIDGEIDLCGSHLRAPPPTRRRASENAMDALDLTLAEVKGDIQMLEARCEGRFKMRTAHVAGDIWMTGATFENPGDEPGEHAIQLQGARIDGFLMMNGGFAEFGKTGPYRQFTCHGRLKLEAAEIARSVYLEDAAVRGPIDALHLTVADDLILSADVSGAINMTGCRIGGSLDISRLNLTVDAAKVSLKDGSIGRTLRVAPPAPLYRFVAGRQRVIDGAFGIKLVETLWRTAGEERHQAEEESPARYDQVRAAFLTIGWCDRFAKIYHLDGHGEVLERVKARLPRRKAAWRDCGAIEGLRTSYVLTGERPFGPDDDSGRLENGLFVLPRRARERHEPVPLKDDWFPAGEWQKRPPSRPLIGRLAAFVRPKPLLQARFDLEGLSCDTLRDGGGWAWGNHSDRIDMNHFVYRRADWRAEPSVARGTGRILRWLKWFGTTLIAFASRKGPTLTGRWAERPRPDPVETRRTRSSAHWLLDWWKGIVADYLWLPLTAHLSGVLREESAYLSPWQVRRNWIYRQFPLVSRKQRDLISISRYRIGENEYRPQPFENAIAVARAEGREELAVHFEMLKRRIEWRLFNQWIRWPLAFVAITLGAVWLLRNKGDPVATVGALAATLFMMTFVSLIDNRLRWAWHWFRRIAREVILYSPAILLLLVFDDWHDHPFHFILAFLIFVGIRFISFFASVVMRFGFGYLRRPAQALVTLIAAFLLGWWGVSVANRHRMLVLAAEPATNMVAPDASLNYTHEDPENPHPEPDPLVAGTAKVEAGPRFVHEVSCDPTVSEPLYALDVLIPLVDLHEESRCEIRRLAEAEHSPAAIERARPPDGKHVAAPQPGEAPAPHAEPPAEERKSGQMKIGELWRKLPELTIEHHRFWWWMKALYAIAGWFIVSLALLTFAQVNRTHGEPAEGD
jgi:hypothetical protein